MDDSDERPTDVIDAVAGIEETTTTVTDDNLGPGTEVGGYIIDGALGYGGMGQVYSATHPLIGKRAAIKVLKPDLSRDPAAVERFVLEARAVNQIGHPNIVDIYDFGVLDDGRRYYLMDLLEGEPLRARLQRTGALHVSEAASVIDETASALAAAHDKGIVHRDLKPDNVFMVNVSGRWPEVRLLDWGLAKLLRGATGKYQTVTGSVLGTPVYMSPEQARGDDRRRPHRHLRARRDGVRAAHRRGAVQGPELGRHAARTPGGAGAVARSSGCRRSPTSSRS